MLNPLAGSTSLIQFARATYNDEILYFTIPRPSDFHVHFREEQLMRAVARDIMRHMRYLLAMPNNGPIKTIEQAVACHEKLMAIARKEVRHKVRILMTLYRTDEVTPAVIERLARSTIVRGVKHYPPHPGATTGSGLGIPLEEGDATYRAMEDTGVPLLGHFEEVVDKYNRVLPPAEREAYCFREKVRRLRDKYPRLRICSEHASTKEAVDFVKEDTSGRRVMTNTPQHLLFMAKDFTRRPSWAKHLKCMPIVKKPEDVEAVLDFATSGDPRVWAGSDTAPHPSQDKTKPFDECASGCWVPHAVALYALAFERAGALDDRFARFMSINGPTWWELPLPEQNDTIRISRETKYDIPNPAQIMDESDKTVVDIVIPLGWSDQYDRLHIGLRCDSV